MESHTDRIDIKESVHGWSVAGEIDAGTSTRLADAFARLPGEIGVPIEVDLAQVTFIDSSGLRVLLQLADSVAAAGGTTVIRNPSKSVTKLLAITQLESRFGLI